MAAKVFLCYRRGDSAGDTGRVHDRLGKEFELFMDVESLLGVNYATALRDAVAKCEVLLAVIGPNWLNAADEAGNRRLDDPHDWVRIEIGAALQRNIPVVPILLEGTKVPKPEQLPEDLKELPLRSGLNVHHASFHNDMNKLIEGIKRTLIETKVEKRREKLEKVSAVRIIEENGDTRLFHVEVGSTYTIGRAKDVHIVLSNTDLTVSRHHAKMIVNDNYVQVVDQGSINRIGFENDPHAQQKYVEVELYQTFFIGGAKFIVVP